MGNSEAEDIKWRDLRQNHTGNQAAQKEAIKMAIDPVCKMEVEESQAAATSEYKGEKYYFCAVGCKKAFDLSPENYLDKEERDKSRQVPEGE